MTSQEFVLWLKGFTEGVHEFNVSPKQWDILKEKLAEVKDEPTATGKQLLKDSTYNYTYKHNDGKSV